MGPGETTPYLIENGDSEAPDNFFNLYSSQNNLSESISKEFTNLENNMKIEAKLNSMNLNIFNTLEYNDFIDNTLNELEKIDYDSLSSSKGHISNDPYGNTSLLGNFSGNKVISLKKTDKFNFKEKDSIQHDTEHYKTKEITLFKTNEINPIYNTNDEIVVDESYCSSERTEVPLSLCNHSYSDENEHKKATTELSESCSVPLSEKKEITYSECPLTSDFFDTIENLNTKVFEKYNNLKGCSENLIENVNKLSFDKKISDLLQIHDENSDFINQFKKKSEECIRKCQKFETISENLISECINTLADSSICYARWVNLHSYQIDPIYEQLDDIKLFIEANE
ncbi:conserved protein, unknown function [Hepatocystis sp. ex Piliocolobus tephrosceles]|nr:conserved protein, unknown function [Hepatocystis sp. ex Piliocolobus tephrosceles]